MTVILTEELDRFVREEVERGVSASGSDYIKDLLQARYLAKHAETLDAALARGIADADGGRSIPVDDAFHRLKDALGLAASHRT